MEIRREQLEDEVVGLLGPYLGDSMARASVVGHCRSLSIEGSTLNGAQLAQLVDRLRKGMTLFVGERKSEALAAALKRRLGMEEQE